MKHVLIILFLLAIKNGYGQESEAGCIFDQSTQTDDFIKNIKEFSNYHWDDKKKEAKIILKNGDTLVAFRGGCDHFGISGTLTEPNSKHPINDFNYWFDKALWISKRLFHEVDYNIVLNSIAEKTYTLSGNDNFIYVIIPHETYSEFAITITKENTAHILSVGYYF